MQNSTDKVDPLECSESVTDNAQVWTDVLQSHTSWGHFIRNLT